MLYLPLTFSAAAYAEYCYIPVFFYLFLVDLFSYISPEARGENIELVVGRSTRPIMLFGVTCTDQVRSVITLAASSGKRNVTVWRPSVCLSSLYFT